MCADTHTGDVNTLKKAKLQYISRIDSAKLSASIGKVSSQRTLAICGRWHVVVSCTFVGRIDSRKGKAQCKIEL